MDLINRNEFQFTCMAKCGGSTSGEVDKCCKINSSLCASHRSTPLRGS